MNVKILDVENETVMVATLDGFCKIWSKDVGVVKLSNGSYVAVLLRYGLMLKDTLTNDVDATFAAFKLKIENVKQLHIIGAETGAAGFCEKLNIDYPLNPEYR